MKGGSYLAGGRVTRRDLLRIAGALAGAVGLSGLAAACTAASSPSGSPAGASGPPQRGGTLTYASSAEIFGFDPDYSSDSVTEAALRLVYNRLVALDPDHNLVPDLATSWAASGKTWTFKLRPGVKFHDGTAFDATAAKFKYDRILGPENVRQKSTYDPYIDKIEVVDDLTIRFTTKDVDAFFPYRLAFLAGYMESPAAVGQYGKDIASHPVGTGPFKFDSWVKDQQLVVVRNDNYWGNKAYLDKVVIRPITENEARAIALEAGDVQLAIRINPESVARIDSNPKLKTLTKTTARNLFIGLANWKKPFSDLRVRQALNYAVDKDAIIKGVYLGTAAEICPGPVMPGTAGRATVSGYGFDLAKAKQLLADAGYPNGFSAKMFGTKGSYLKDFELQQAVQQQLKAVGVNLTLETVEFAKYLDVILAPAPMTNSPLETWLDGRGTLYNAASQLLQTYGCKWMGDGWNEAGSCFSDIDALSEEALHTLDDTKRNALLKDAQDKMTQQAPSIFLLNTRETAGMSKKLQGAILTIGSTLTVDENTWLMQ